MGFPNGREFAVLCKSDGVRGIVSHRGTQRHGEHGGQGEWGISDAEREQEYREERGGAESYFKFLSIHLTEDPDLQDADRVRR